MRSKYRGDASGFTIVEMIVVCVIVAILAAVSIPIYSGYVRDQKFTAAGNLAETAAAAANSYYRRTGTILADGNITPKTQPLNLYFNASNYQVTVSGVNIIVNDLKTTIVKDTASYR